MLQACPPPLWHRTGPLVTRSYARSCHCSHIPGITQAHSRCVLACASCGVRRAVCCCASGALAALSRVEALRALPSGAGKPMRCLRMRPLCRHEGAAAPRRRLVLPCGHTFCESCISTCGPAVAPHAPSFLWPMPRLEHSSYPGRVLLLAGLLPTASVPAFPHLSLWLCRMRACLRTGQLPPRAACGHCGSRAVLSRRNAL